MRRRVCCSDGVGAADGESPQRARTPAARCAPRAQPASACGACSGRLRLPSFASLRSAHSRRGSPSALAPFSPTPATAQLPLPHSYRDRRPPPLPPQHSDRYNTATRRARWSRTDCDSPHRFRSRGPHSDRLSTAQPPAFPRAARTFASLTLAGPRARALCFTPATPRASHNRTDRTRAEVYRGIRRRRAHGQEHRPIRAGARAAGREPSSASLPGFQCRGRHCQPGGSLSYAGPPAPPSSSLLLARAPILTPW
jgi:hypothetical protein